MTKVLSKSKQIRYLGYTISEKGGRSQKAPFVRGHPRRELEQRIEQLAGVEPQQRGQHERGSEQQLRVPCRQDNFTGWPYG